MVKMNELENDPNVRKMFMVAGNWTTEETMDIEKRISSLGGIFSGNSSWVYDCTHVIAKTYAMSEKVMGALAAGRWVLTKRFVERSVTRNAWQNEKPYVSDDAVLRHRQLWFETNGGCFRGMKAVFLMDDEPFKRDVYTRVILAGGGEVDIWINLKALTTRVPRVDHTQVTHIIVDPSMLKEDHPDYAKFKEWRDYADTQEWQNGQLYYVHYKFLTEKIKAESAITEANWSIFIPEIQCLAEKIKPPAPAPKRTCFAISRQPNKRRKPNNDPEVLIISDEENSDDDIQYLEQRYAEETKNGYIRRNVKKLTSKNKTGRESYRDMIERQKKELEESDKKKRAVAAAQGRARNGAAECINIDDDNIECIDIDDEPAPGPSGPCIDIDDEPAPGPSGPNFITIEELEVINLDCDSEDELIHIAIHEDEPIQHEIPWHQPCAVPARHRPSAMEVDRDERNDNSDDESETTDSRSILNLVPANYSEREIFSLISDDESDIEDLESVPTDGALYLDPYSELAVADPSTISFPVSTRYHSNSACNNISRPAPILAESLTTFPKMIPSLPGPVPLYSTSSELAQDECPQSQNKTFSASNIRNIARNVLQKSPKKEPNENSKTMDSGVSTQMENIYPPLSPSPDLIERNDFPCNPPSGMNILKSGIILQRHDVLPEEIDKTATDSNWDGILKSGIILQRYDELPEQIEKTIIDSTSHCIKDFSSNLTDYKIRGLTFPIDDKFSKSVLKTEFNSYSGDQETLANDADEEGDCNLTNSLISEDNGTDAVETDIPIQTIPDPLPNKDVQVPANLAFPRPVEKLSNTTPIIPLVNHLKQLNMKWKESLNSVPSNQEKTSEPISEENHLEPIHTVPFTEEKSAMPNSTVPFATLPVEKPPDPLPSKPAKKPSVKVNANLDRLFTTLLDRQGKTDECIAISNITSRTAKFDKLNDLNYDEIFRIKEVDGRIGEEMLLKFEEAEYAICNAGNQRPQNGRKGAMNALDEAVEYSGETEITEDELVQSLQIVKFETFLHRYPSSAILNLIFKQYFLNQKSTWVIKEAFAYMKHFLFLHSGRDQSDRLRWLQIMLSAMRDCRVRNPLPKFNINNDSDIYDCWNFFKGTINKILESIKIHNKDNYIDRNSFVEEYETGAWAFLTLLVETMQMDFEIWWKHLKRTKISGKAAQPLIFYLLGGEKDFDKNRSRGIVHFYIELVKHRQDASDARKMVAMTALLTSHQDSLDRNLAELHMGQKLQLANSVARGLKESKLNERDLYIEVNLLQPNWFSALVSKSYSQQSVRLERLESLIDSLKNLSLTNDPHTIACVDNWAHRTCGFLHWHTISRANWHFNDHPDEEFLTFRDMRKLAGQNSKGGVRKFVKYKSDVHVSTPHIVSDIKIVQELQGKKDLENDLGALSSLLFKMSELNFF